MIKNITSKEILDSKGVPTLETTVTLDDGTSAIASVPAGSSTGTHEAHELRDGDPVRYQGKGVLMAVKNVNEAVCDNIINRQFNSQKELDDALLTLDGTEDKSGLGANSILSVSIAFCRATANSKGVELYQYIQELSETKELTPLQMNILVMEGGKHGNWAADIQEYMIIPRKDVYPSVPEALEVAKNITQKIRDILSDKMYDTTIGMEGGFAPKELQSNKESLEIIMDGIVKAGYKPKDEILVGIDFASSEFFKDGHYSLKKEGKKLDTHGWIEYLKQLIKPFPIWYLEDSLSEDDWEGWTTFTKMFGEKYQVVGDDLLTTNIERIKKGIKLKSMNAVIIKPNQIGTVSETIEAIKLAEESKLPTVISHRGGETEDTFIADLAAGTPSSQTKYGGPTRKERLSKYYRLIEIYSK